MLPTDKLKLALAAYIATVAEMHPHPTPDGLAYTALMELGASLEQFQAIRRCCVDAGHVVAQGHAVTATDSGLALGQKVSAILRQSA